MYIFLVVVFGGCTSGLTCGQGTTEQDGACVATAAADETGLDTSADDVVWECPEDLPSDDTFSSYAPVVVCTVPRVGDTAVDPALTELRATFSKDMQDGSWSWVQISDRTFPEATGDASYETARTNVLPVALEPDKTYVVWLNADPYLSFQDEDGNAAIPFQWTFKTASE